MVTRRLSVLILLVVSSLVLIPSRNTLRSDDWPPINPSELQMTSEPLAPGAPAIYLFRQVDRKDAGNANTEYNYVRMKILTEEGREKGNIIIPYRKERMNISGLRARTIHPDGKIINFEGKAFDQTVERTKGMKIFAKTFSMPDVQVGSVLEYRYNVDFEDGYVFNSYWTISDDLFTKKAQFTLKPYSRFALQWSWPAGLPPNTEPPKQDDHDGIIKMSTQNVPPFIYEEMMPPENELKMRVDFIYFEDAPEQDVDKFWKQYGKKHSGPVEEFVNKRKAMEAAVSQIVSPSDSPEAKLRKIYARCQQVRNLSFEPPKTGDELKREYAKINSVEDVLKNGYGWGNQINMLFLALARAAGFQADYVMVSSRDEHFFNPKLKNSSDLNGDVVVVKLDGKDWFFDPATVYCPFGLLPWAESGLQGRRLDKDGGAWVATSQSTSADSKIIRKADLKLNTEGGLEGKVTVTYTGVEALNQRLPQRNQDATHRKEFLENELKNMVPVVAEVTLTNDPKWTSSEEPLVAEYDFKLPGWASSAGQLALIPVGIFINEEKHRFEHANRVQPLYYPYFFTRVDQVNIELPLGWTVSSVPKDLDVDAKAAQYTIKVTNDKIKLKIDRTIRSDLTLLSKDNYPTLRNFYDRIRTGDEQQIVVKPMAGSVGK